jgi:hypothetical protein
MFHLPSDLIDTINCNQKDKRVLKLNTYLTHLYNDLYLSDNTILLDLGKFVDDVLKKTKGNTNIAFLYRELNKIVNKYDNVIIVSNEIRKKRYIYFYNNIINYMIGNNIKKNCILVYCHYQNILIKHKLINKIISQNKNIKLFYENTIDTNCNTENSNYHIQVYNNVNNHEFICNVNFNDIKNM